MSRFERSVSGAVALAIALWFGGTGALAAPSSASSGPTPEQMASMTPEQQDAVLHPLNILANALDAVGRSSEAATYAGLELDAQTGTVKLYLVDQSRSSRFLNEAARQDHTIDLSRVRVLPANHSRKQLDAARDQLIQAGAPAGYEVASVSVPVDGSQLQVGLRSAAAAGATFATAQVAALGQALSATAGVPVAAVAAQAAGLTSRYADGKPYIAGENITTSPAGGNECTSGVPVVDNSGSGVYLVTAAHCAANNTYIFNGNGHVMGLVVKRDTLWDADLYKVGTNAKTDANADAFDGPPSSIHWLPLRNTHYSYLRQQVCQDGYTDGILCGIQVTNQDLTYCFPGYACVRGVEGHRAAGTATRPGDSGGLVFCVCAGSSPYREVRGGVTGWIGDDTNLFWTESLDVYNSFHVHLNPNT